MATGKREKREKSVETKIDESRKKAKIYADLRAIMKTI